MGPDPRPNDLTPNCFKPNSIPPIPHSNRQLGLKALVGNNPRLFSYQNSLPTLPLPCLDDTISRYLRTVRPLLDDDAYHTLVKKSELFKSTCGHRLQRYLALKSWVSANYVSDWWEEYVYLRGRSPIMVSI